MASREQHARVSSQPSHFYPNTRPACRDRVHFHAHVVQQQRHDVESVASAGASPAMSTIFKTPAFDHLRPQNCRAKEGVGRHPHSFQRHFSSCKLVRVWKLALEASNLSDWRWCDSRLPSQGNQIGSFLHSNLSPPVCLQNRKQPPCLREQAAWQCNAVTHKTLS